MSLGQRRVFAAAWGRSVHHSGSNWLGSWLVS